MKKFKIKINKNILSFLIINTVFVILIILLVLLTKNIIYIIASLILLLLINIMNYYRIYLYQKENDIDKDIDSFIIDSYFLINSNTIDIANIKLKSENEIINKIIELYNLDNLYDFYSLINSEIKNNYKRRLLIYLFSYLKEPNNSMLNLFNNEYLEYFKQYKEKSIKKDKLKTSLIMMIPLFNNIFIIISILSMCLINIWR